MSDTTRPAAPPDRLAEALSETFSFNFPFISQHAKHKEDKRLVGTSPFMFYDRHVNESQRLKYVASLPTLVDDITRMLDDRLDWLKKTGKGPLPVWPRTIVDSVPLLKGSRRYTDQGDRLVTPNFLGRRHISRLSRACLPFASSWVIHPEAQKYYSALQFYFEDRGHRPPTTSYSSCENLKIRFAPPGEIHPGVLESVDDVVKATLADWHDRDLVTWMFLPLSADSEELLRSLDQLSDHPGVLTSACCATQGLPISLSDIPQPEDASTTPWILPPADPRDEQPSVTSDNAKASAPVDGVIYPLPSQSGSRSKFLEMQDPTPEGLAHHVWRLAVQNDTTVIVMNCGNYERIGIRHRGSQTLYISDMIDLTQTGYGKIHLGIIMSAVDDALRRHQAFRDQSPASKTKKRPRVSEKNEVRRSKRQKLNILLEKSRDRPPLSQRDCQHLWREIAKRPLLLLQFSGGGLNSSIPACCVRKGSSFSSHVEEIIDFTSNEIQKSYQLSESFVLTLDWESSSGVSGQVFNGHLQVTLPDGRKLFRNVVAKIAFFQDAQETVRGEYDIYQHLWSRKIKRIPEIYGLFEDVDNLATILVTERAAYTFRTREPMTNENQGMLHEVHPSERLALMGIVKEIHDAGVIHCDLRAENLVIAQDGKPMVIDFDQALLGAPDEALEVELKALEDLLSGRPFFRFR